MGYAHNKIESIETNPSAISRNLFHYSASIPRWFLLLLVTSITLSCAFVLPLFYENQSSIVATHVEDWRSKDISYPVSSSSSPIDFDSQSIGQDTPPPIILGKEIDESFTQSFQSFDIRQNLTNNIPALMGMVFCGVSTLISALVLMVSLPIFLLSSNVDQVKRAGGLVKTTLGFFVSSSAAILATITFIN